MLSGVQICPMRSWLHSGWNFQHRRDIVILSEGIASPLCALEHSAEPFSGTVLALIPALARVPYHRLKLASLLLCQSW